MAARIYRWLIFAILFSLLPLLASYLEVAAKSNEGWPDLGLVLEHGELYLLAASFSAVGLGEVIGVNANWQVAKIVIGGVSLLQLAISMFMFAFVNSQTGQHINKIPLDFSYFVFAFSCVASTCCIALSEIRDE